jgi:invasion protein IalB
VNTTTATVFPPILSIPYSHAVVIDDQTIARTMKDKDKAIKRLQVQVALQDNSIKTLQEQVGLLLNAAQDHRTQVALLWNAVEVHRTRSLNAVTKTTIEAFLSLFGFKGTNRKACISRLRLPDWALECMSKESLESEVKHRCVETAENTTHAANGSEALQTILYAYKDEKITEEEYRLLVPMLIAVYKGATMYKAPIDGSLSGLLADEERFNGLITDMTKDLSWEVRARRVLGGGVGGKSKKKKIKSKKKKIKSKKKKIKSKKKKIKSKKKKIICS